MKQESHILFDHLQGYYGVTSLEALSQGLCVVAGLDEWNKRHIREYFGVNDLPWVDCPADTIAETLSTLIHDDAWPSLSKQTRHFMTTAWNDEFLAHEIGSFYASAIG